MPETFQDITNLHAREKFARDTVSFPELVYEVTKATIKNKLENAASSALQPLLGLAGYPVGGGYQSWESYPDNLTGFLTSTGSFATALATQGSSNPATRVTERMLNRQGVLSTAFSDDAANIPTLLNNDPGYFLNLIMQNHLGFGYYDVENVLNQVKGHFNASVD